jgi:DNA polymerase elongation subunit (family B)
MDPTYRTPTRETTLPTPLPRPCYALDIETTSLEWPKGRITTLAVYNPEVSFVVEDTDEARLILALADRLADLPAGTICTWNGACFDVPYLVGRSRALGLPEWWDAILPDRHIVPRYDPQPGFDAFGYHLHARAAGEGVHDHLDVAYLWREWAERRRTRWSLKAVARANGLGVIEVDREHMEQLSVAERMAYNLSDVVATWHLARQPTAMAA